MNLTSMQISAEEAKEYTGAVAEPGNAPKYPWGLCVELNDESLKKLGITELPAVGSTLLLMAHVTVQSVSASQQVDGDKESRASLQITEMALGAPTSEDAAAKLWPSVVCTNASKVLTSTCTSATPSFGATTVTTLNGHTFTAGSSTFTGTAAQTYTFPTTSATLARTDAANTFTGSQTFSSTGPHAFGGSTSTDIGLWIQGAYSPTGSTGYGTAVNQVLTGAVNQTLYGTLLTGTLNKAASGTHTDFVGVEIDAPAIGAGGAALTNATTLKVGAAPNVGTNQRALWVISGTTQFDGQTIAKGSATNDSAAAGYIGELLTTTVASGSAVSLTTATSANIATLSLTAGDWDCSAQVTHNAAATTSVTLLQIGISATTATLPTQAGGSGIGTDPLAIWRQAAAVPGGALTTNVGPVRVSLSGTTSVFLVANDTFTVSTMTGYGTIRCRRMR